jgi:3-deoxy-D-manno-octulosonic-acid transferase
VTLARPAPAPLRSAMLRWAYDLLGAGVALAFSMRSMMGKLLGGNSADVARERLGRYGDLRGLAFEGPTRRRVVWVHAASVGEISAASAILPMLREELPGFQVLLTCQTATGRQMGFEKGFDEIRYFPVDFRGIVRRVLDRVKPSLFVFVETEIWPRLLLELAHRGTPSVMVSARVSARAFGRYRRATSLFAPSLACVARVCARDAESLERLVGLGVDPERVTVCGDLKLDVANAQLRDANESCDVDDVLGAGFLLALSTHEGEETMVLEAFDLVRESHPTMRLVIAPRHPNRCESVMALARAHGRTLRWSSCTRGAGSWDVIVVDTVGEIPRLLGAATCAFVGGSLVDIGGHNLWEPAAHGVPSANGPHVSEVAHQAELLAEADALHTVTNAKELALLWSRWIDDPRAAREAGARARRAVRAGEGATARTRQALAPILAAVRAGGCVP